MTGATFRDQLVARNHCLHSLAVWQEVHEHLAKFLDTDATKAKLGITSEGDGMTVPQEIVEEIRGQVQEHVDKMHAERDRIDQKKVAEDDDSGKTKKQASGKAKGSKSPARLRKSSSKGQSKKRPRSKDAGTRNPRRSAGRAADAAESSAGSAATD